MTIACPDCGTVQDLPRLPFRGSALCPVCDRRLERTSGRSLDAALACSLATLILLLPANLAPLMSVSMLGMTRESRAGSGVVSLWQASWVIIAICVALFVVLLPVIRFGLLTTVLGCVRVNRRPRWLGRAVGRLADDLATALRRGTP